MYVLFIIKCMYNTTAAVSNGSISMYNRADTCRAVCECSVACLYFANTQRMQIIRFFVVVRSIANLYTLYLYTTIRKFTHIDGGVDIVAIKCGGYFCTEDYLCVCVCLICSSLLEARTKTHK